MKRLLVIFLILLSTSPARADLFGGDVAVLTQILANAIQQLSTLNQILRSGGDTLNLLREVNKGINDSLDMIRTIDPNTDPGLYKDWETAQQALLELQRVYGTAAASTSETQVQKDTDQSVAEAISLNNSLYGYTKEIDDLGEEIKKASHHVSPGGAQKLTAEALGVILHVMNSSLRAQATALKLQAQSMAVQNRIRKEETRHALRSSDSIQKAYSRKATFNLPRF